MILYIVSLLKKHTPNDVHRISKYQIKNKSPDKLKSLKKMENFTVHQPISLLSPSNTDGSPCALFSQKVFIFHL